MLELLAQTQTQTPAPAPTLTQNIVQYLPLVMVLLLLYFFVFNAKRKDEKTRKALIDAIKKGDKIQTIGGILGTVLQAEAGSDEIVVKVDESTNTKMRFVRSAVAKVVTAESTKADAK